MKQNVGQKEAVLLSCFEKENLLKLLLFAHLRMMADSNSSILYISET